MLRRPLLAGAVALFPATAWAVGGMDDVPPTPTETTTACTEGEIWDVGTESCQPADTQSFNDADRYEAVRELAYAGAHDRARRVLATFEDPEDDGRLTYLGFVARKQGDLAAGLRWYDAAIAANPDNLLARSYLGMALLEMEDRAGATRQLAEIRARGGRETWPARALELALRDGPRAAY